MNDGVRIEHDRTWEIPIVFEPAVGPSRPPTCLVFEAPLSALDECTVAVLKALVEVSAAAIALSRLGIPRRTEVVSVRISGPLPAASLLALERILYIFMWSRGRRAGQPPRVVSVSILSAGEARPIEAGELDRRSAVVAFSGGLDSTVCLKHLLASGHRVRSIFCKYYVSPAGELKGELTQEQRAVEAISGYLGKTAGGTWTHRERTVNILPLDSIPYKTLVDDVDNDPWPFYGRNFLTATLMLWEALTARSEWTVLGVTAEDMFATETAGTEEFYSDCCQSAPFFSLFNSALDGIFEGAHPALVAPLHGIHKGGIAAYLARDPDLLARTRSCISDGRREDATCFSCFDKITGILSAFPPEELDVRVHDGALMLLSSGSEIARFHWLSTNAHGDSNERYSFPEASSTQLRRLLPSLQNGHGRLWHSKFNPAAILEMLHNLRPRQDLLAILFPGPDDRELVARVYDAVDASGMASLAGPWAEPKAPLDLSQAAGRLEELVDWRLVPQSGTETSGSRRLRPSPRS